MLTSEYNDIFTIKNKIHYAIIVIQLPTTTNELNK